MIFLTEYSPSMFTIWLTWVLILKDESIKNSQCHHEMHLTVNIQSSSEKSETIMELTGHYQRHRLSTFATMSFMLQDSVSPSKRYVPQSCGKWFGNVWHTGVVQLVIETRDSLNVESTSPTWPPACYTSIWRGNTGPTQEWMHSS